MSDNQWAPNVQVFGPSFLAKLREAVPFNLDYWSRSDKPNLSETAFLAILPHIPATIDVKWEWRDSERGVHGHHGEDRVFEFECSTRLLGRSGRYYVKGYFYTRNKLGGVTIQSFREVKRRPTPIK